MLIFVRNACDTTFHLALALFTSLRQKYGTLYLFTSANPKHTLLSDVVLRHTTFTQPILPPSGPRNVSSETLVLSIPYLLTYVNQAHVSVAFICA